MERVSLPVHDAERFRATAIDFLWTHLYLRNGCELIPSLPSWYHDARSANLNVPRFTKVGNVEVIPRRPRSSSAGLGMTSTTLPILYLFLRTGLIFLLSTSTSYTLHFLTSISRSSQLSPFVDSSRFRVWARHDGLCVFYHSINATIQNRTVLRG